MTRAACSARAHKAASQVEGVRDAQVNLLQNTMDVVYDGSPEATAAICAAVDKAGYGAAVRQDGNDATGEPAAAVKPKVLSPADSLAEARRQAMKVAQQYPQVPGGKYLIVGTRRVHTMKVGDSLLKLALKEYGHKDFAQYIIIYNQFQNPDVIHVGQEVNLPELIENGAPEAEEGSAEFQYPR